MDWKMLDLKASLPSYKLSLGAKTTLPGEPPGLVSYHPQKAGENLQTQTNTQYVYIYSKAPQFHFPQRAYAHSNALVFSHPLINLYNKS
jgi:hypothetical protein